MCRPKSLFFLNIFNSSHNKIIIIIISVPLLLEIMLNGMCQEQFCSIVLEDDKAHIFIKPLLWASYVLVYFLVM